MRTEKFVAGFLGSLATELKKAGLTASATKCEILSKELLDEDFDNAWVPVKDRVPTEEDGYAINDRYPGVVEVWPDSGFCPSHVGWQQVGDFPWMYSHWRKVVPPQ